MTAKTRILKINADGNLVEWNNGLRRFELTSRSWSWSDITKGYVRESKRNYKTNNS
jgi:hypothetical protein